MTTQKSTQKVQLNNIKLNQSPLPQINELIHEEQKEEIEEEKQKDCVFCRVLPSDNKCSLC